MSQNKDSGLLFKNFRKKQPNHPDYTGTCEINGVAMEIAAWIKPLKSGKGKFMSLSFSPPRPKRNTTGLPSEGEASQPDAPADQPETETEVTGNGDGFIV